MSLEGRLRELGLGEVLQLLSLSRRTGTLHLRSQLDAREARIVIDAGFIVDASHSESLNTTREVSLFDRALELLSWVEGEFRFSAHTVERSVTANRISIDSVLMEGARREAAAAALEGMFDGPHVVPVFPDVEPKQLSLLHLAPDEWEILTRVDGVRTLSDLGESLGQDLIEVATTVRGLIDAGVLTIGSRPTDVAPTTASSTPASIPPVYSPEMPFVLPYDASDDDSLFDPMQVGVMTPDGMPTMSEDATQDFPVTRSGRSVTNSSGEAAPVAEAADTSRRSRVTFVQATLLRDGDSLARAGDLQGACEVWQRWLDETATASRDEVSAVQQRIRLARQLSALLHS